MSIFAFFLFTIFSFLPSVAFAVTLQKPSNYLGTIGYWTFDGKDTNWQSNTTNDISGGGNNGVMTNMSTSTSPTIGKFGQALSFDDSDDYVSIADANPLDVTDNDSLTITGWFNRATFNNIDALLFKRNGVLPGFRGYGVYIRASDEMTFEVSDGTNEYSLDSNTLFTAPGWNHFAIVWDPNSAANTEIYINGVADNAIDTGTISSVGDLSNALIVAIGTQSDGTIPFSGKLDEFRMYNRALSPTEIARLYRAGAAKMQASQNARMTSGLVGMWDFNGANMNWGANTVTDASGGGDTGTMSGMSKSTAPVVGRVGQALKFDGVDDIVTVTSALDGYANISVSAWVYYVSSAGAQQFIVGEETVYKVDIDAAGCGCFRFLTETGSNWGTTILSSATTLTPNTWYHVVATYDGTTKRLYVNGVQDPNTVTTSGSITNAGLSPTIGARGAGLDESSGKIDEVRIYNRALSPAEIKQLYLMGGSNDTRSGNSTITMGEMAILGTDDSNNADQIIAQQATTTIPANIQSLSFYVSTAAGNLRLGVYDATGPGSGPGNKLAETNGFVPVVGWNTVSVTAPVYLPAGTYWIAFLSDNNGMHNWMGTPAQARYCYYGTAYAGGLPDPFSASPTCNNFHGSFYATLTASTTISLPGTGSTHVNHSQNTRLTNGLVGMWSFNGQDTDWRTNTVSDVSGNGNTGMMINMATRTTPVAGKVGQAFSLTGTLDTVQVPTPSGVLGITDGLTIAAWVFLPSDLSSSDYPGILAKTDTLTLWDYDYYIAPSGIPTFYSDSPGITLPAISAVGTNQWHHIVVTHSGSTFTFYLDGGFDRQTTQAGTFANNSLPIWIGNDTSGAETGGKLDEVRVYNRALSAAEIKQLYLMGK